MKPLIAIAFTTILLLAGCKGKESAPVTAGAKRTFIMIHFEAGYKACNPLAINLPQGLTADVCSQGWQEYFWPKVIELVQKADEYGYKLTLAFTPQWGEFIANDSTRLNLVRQWKTQGHEIGFHHHGLNHPDWDGYANVYSKGTDTVNDPLYLGTVNDGFSFVAALVSPDDIISSVVGSLPDDYPSLMNSPTVVFGRGNQYNSYPQSDLYPQFEPEPRSLRPIKTQMPERDLVELTTREFSTVMDISALPVLKEQYRNMKQDEVFGIVWHEFDYFQKKGSYIQWFDFIRENGNSVKTMREVG